MPDIDYAIYPASTGQEMAMYRSGPNPTDSAWPYTAIRPDRVVSGNYMAATYRIPATNATNHHICSIENKTGSGVLVAIRQIEVDIQVSAVTAMLLVGEVKLHRSANVATGGTAVTKTQLDTVRDATSNANVVMLGAASTDGTASAITISNVGGSAMNVEVIPKILTGVGQWVTTDLKLWEKDWPPLVLREVQTAQVWVPVAIPVHFHYIVKVWWEEFSRP